MSHKGLLIPGYKKGTKTLTVFDRQCSRPRKAYVCHKGQGMTELEATQVDVLSSFSGLGDVAVGLSLVSRS